MTQLNKVRIAYAAGNRDLAVWVLRFLLSDGVKPLALLCPDLETGRWSREIASLCAYLPAGQVLVENTWRESEGKQTLSSLDLDYIVCVRFPYIVPAEILSLPKIGVTNLHPALLPYNRGWHTPSWSILDGTPYGATLHFMNAKVDSGDIIHQKEMQILPSDTAHSLYQRVKRLELEVFKEAWPSLKRRSPRRSVQDENVATFHKRSDLFKPEVQALDVDATVTVRNLVDRLRALTTSRLEESAHIEVEGVRYRLQLRLVREKRQDDDDDAFKAPSE